MDCEDPLNESIENEDILDELDNYLIDENEEINIGEIEIPEDLSRDDVLDEIEDYLIDSNEEVDIGEIDII